MDMKAVLARIEDWIARQNEAGNRVSVASLSRKATNSPDTIRNWIRQRNDGKSIGATALKVQQVAGAMGVNADWLITGEGEPGTGQTLTADQIPLISWVSAGRLSAQDGVTELDDFPTILVADLPPGRWIALRVSGTSMNKISPPESVIIVNLDDHRLISGKCYVIADETGAASYKAYDPKEDPPFQPRSYAGQHSLELSGEVRVIGRVYRTMLDL